MLKRVLAFPVYTFAIILLTLIWLVAAPILFIGRALAEVTAQLRETVLEKEEEE